MRFLYISVILLLLIHLCHGDIYLHGPRGSNNRLNENGRERNNANRLFDSQNNNRGGYNVGSVYYYETSITNFEWSPQHSCGDEKADCEIVIQYMCDDRLRDGTTTNTIPNNNDQCKNADCDTDATYGRQESYDWYRSCRLRERNKGLFTSTQNLNSDSATSTRQNPNGERFGYECAEERDYYPYWAPTPWRDLAIFTNRAQRCAAYQAESQNVKAKYFCTPPPEWLKTQINRLNTNQNFQRIPISQAKCEALQDTVNGNVTATGVWTKQEPFGIPAPFCQENQLTRDNHHGNTFGGSFPSYNWTVPSNLIHENCAIRMRYNITTGDIANNGGIFQGLDSVQAGSLTSQFNKNVTSGGTNRFPATVRIWSKYSIKDTEVSDSFKSTTNDPNNAAARVNTREYVLKDNPQVDMFGSLLDDGTNNNKGKVKLQLAINTAQYGRTFEDRSHRFAIRSLPTELKSLGDSKIYNVQVRGKRGNIVQVYPAVEYDFQPTRLQVRPNDYIHFQWTGSNGNPDNNAGQGKAGTDRSNIVQTGPSVYFETGQTPVNNTYGQFGRAYPATFAQADFLGFSKQLLRQLATLESTGAPSVNLGGNQRELDDASTYFDLGPQKVTKSGIYHYMCTRNNNFSNRDQKAKIVVKDSAAAAAMIGWNGGIVQIPAALVSVPQGTLTTLNSISVESIDRSQLPDGAGGVASPVSEYIIISPTDIPVVDGNSFQLTLAYDISPISILTVYRADSLDSPYEKVTTFTSLSGRFTMDANSGGVYVVSSKPNAGAIAGIVIGGVVVVSGITYFLYKKFTSFQQNKHRPVSSKA